MNMISNVKISTVFRGDTAADSTDNTPSVLVDMAGYDGCLFLTSIVETTAGGTTGSAQLVAGQSATTATTALSYFGSTSYAGGTATLTTGMWGDCLAVDVYRPLARYLGAKQIKAGAHSWQAGPIFAIRYSGKDSPITQSTADFYKGASGYKKLVSPTT